MFRRARTTGITNHEAAEAAAVSPPERGGLTPVANWPEVGGVLPQMPTRGISAVSHVSSLFAGVCRYYHDCFSADSRGGILTNVLDKSQAEYLTFADGSDVLLTGEASQL